MDKHPRLPFAKPGFKLVLLILLLFSFAAQAQRVNLGGQFWIVRDRGPEQMVNRLPVPVNVASAGHYQINGFILYGQDEYNSAIGTVLFSLIPPVSLLAVFEYAKRKKIDYWVGTILFISYFIFAYVGSLINKMYSEKLLLFLCGIIFIIIGIYFILHSYNKI